MYDQQAGNATLFVNGAAVTSQTSISSGSGTLRVDERKENNAFQTTSAEPEGNLTALRVGAGPDADAAADGRTGLIAYVDEAFVYGTALTVDELDFLYRAAQVRSRWLRNVYSRRKGGPHALTSPQAIGDDFTFS